MSEHDKSKTKTGGGTGSIPGFRNPTVLVLTAKDRVHRLHKERIVLGSVESADVRLGGEGIAPLHAVIELTTDGVGGAASATVYDLASTTGVFVNGQKVITQRIKSGDKVTLGRHELTFSLDDIAKVPAKPDRVRESEGRKLFVNPNDDLKALLLESEAGVEEIFDYRPTSKHALEVVMSWRGTILDVEHFVTEKAVTVGDTRKSHFGIPPLLASGTYAILTRTGDSFSLNLDSRMKGVLQRGGALDQLDATRMGSAVPLGRNDFAKVQIGDIDFYLSYTAAPPRLKRRRFTDKDPFFLKILLASLAFTTAIILALRTMAPPQNLEVEQVPERIATVLYQPEKFTPKPKPEPKATVKETQPKPVEPKKEDKKDEKKQVKIDLKPNPANANKPIPKEMNVAQKQKTQPNKSTATKTQAKAQKAEAKAKEGAGARAKGNEGTRGAKNAPKTSTPQNAAKRPSPQGGPGAGGGASQVPNEGNLDFLKGAGGKIQDILGNAGQKLGKGGEKLAGFGGFTTEGKGGLALSGDGKGGGGNAASLGGLADKGRGGGRVGTGLGAAGDGNGIAGGSARVVLQSGGPDESVVMGSIDASAIEAAILAHRDEFRLCYEREINAENPKLAGRVGVTFVIGSSGRVTQAGVASTSLNNANAERCIIQVMKRIEFPIPKGAGTVQVTYPFKFSPVGR